MKDSTKKYNMAINTLKLLIIIFKTERKKVKEMKFAFFVSFFIFWRYFSEIILIISIFAIILYFKNIIISGLTMQPHQILIGLTIVIQRKRDV